MLLKATVTECWTHADGASPSFVEGINALGTTMPLDIRAALAQPDPDLTSKMQALADRGLGLATWVRLKDPDQSRHEKAPTSMEKDDGIALVLAAAGTSASRALRKRYLRLGAEFMTAPGFIPETEEDGMFEFYEALATAVRAQEPDLCLVSGAFTATGLLLRTTGLDDEQTHKRSMGIRMLNLTKTHLDAISVHSGSQNATDFNSTIDNAVRAGEALSALSGKRLIIDEGGIVDWADRTDVRGAISELRRIVRCARKWGAELFAARPSSPEPTADPDDAERFTWTAYQDENGDPEQPWYDAWEDECICARKSLGFEVI